MTKTRVLLADDHETVRQGLKLILENQPDLTVVGEAADGNAVLELVARVHPDVLVIDISMPQMNGLAATRKVKEVAPDVAVVTLTRHADEAYVQELLSAGASGYVLKQSPSSELLRAIRAAAAGERHLDSTLAARAAEHYVERHAGGRAHPTISEREKSVLRMVAIGFSNKEIAAQLDISVKTVEVHKANAMRKLGLRGRIDVVRYAVLNGWLQEQ
jgi:DNA-binding NarL/FixJ family response regulator